MRKPDSVANASPSVAICVPTYNSEKSIADTLKSLERQTYNNFSVYVFDNNSTDDTLAILKEFVDRNSNFKIFKSELNIGAEGNFRRCVQDVEADYIAIYHADDIYEPNMIQEQVRRFVRHSKILAVFTEAVLIDENGLTVGRRETPKKLKKYNGSDIYNFWSIFRGILRHHNFLMTPSVMVRAEIYKKLRLFDSNQFRSSADLDVWFQILSQGPVAIIPAALMRYRVTATQGSAELIKNRTDRADFFKVVDFYLAKPEINSELTAKDIQNYLWLEKADRVSRALATKEKEPATDLKPLLEKIYDPLLMAKSIFVRPRAFVCAILALTLITRSTPTRPSQSWLIRNLRNLAKV